MSKKFTKEEVIQNKKEAIKSLNKMLEYLINDKSMRHLKKAHLVSYWIKDYVKMITFEENFNPTKNIAYKRGNIVKLNFGFLFKTKKYSNKLHIEREKCIGCGICVSACPMDNISLYSGKAEPKGNCTMCYRCVNHCPKQAITLLGKKVYEQCTIEKYL